VNPNDRCKVCRRAWTAIGSSGATRGLSRRPALLAVLMLVLAGGCVPVPRGDNPLDLRFMSSDELRAYAEKVFRIQNRLTTRLMMAPMAEGSVTRTQKRRIENAEARMRDACASLNRIASARAQGEEIDAELEHGVRRNVRQCEHEARRLRDLLDKLEVGRDPGAGRFEGAITPGKENGLKASLSGTSSKNSTVGNARRGC